jgi:tRNA (guanine10-N2)-dimethyltransferase
MTQTICILGRQPALGLAELESLYGAETLEPIGQQAALVKADPKDVFIDRLGGTLKVCELITYIPSSEWPKILDYLENALPGLTKTIPAGKLRIGLSLYGLQVNTSKINAGALRLKKNLKSATRGVRIVPNKQPDLNTAQVMHNQLTGATGLELVLVRHGKRTALARTVAIQDISAYAARDQARPKRDAKVGMLPPKLAQVIVNLTGAGARRIDTESSCLLDPFCGTGVLLQEALLLGYEVYGTDLEPRMIDYSQVNLDWLVKQHDVPGTYRLETGDATNHTWSHPFHLIAAETYLGRPFATAPRQDVLSEVISDVDTIHKKFLRNVARQTEPGFRMCIAVPAWRTGNDFKHLPTLDHLEELGYTRISFVHARTKELIYHRPDQVVGRELVVLRRK